MLKIRKENAIEIVDRLKRKIIVNAYSDHLIVKVKHIGRKANSMSFPIDKLDSWTLEQLENRCYKLVELETSPRRSFDWRWTSKSLFRGLVNGRLRVNWTSEFVNVEDQTIVNTVYEYLASEHKTVRRYVSDDFIDEVKELGIFDIAWEYHYMNFVKRVNPLELPEVEDILVINMPVEHALEETQVVTALRKYVVDTIARESRIAQVDINLIDKGIVNVTLSRKFDPRDYVNNPPEIDRMIDKIASMMLVDNVRALDKIDSDCKLNRKKTNEYIVQCVRNGEQGVEVEIGPEGLSVRTPYRLFPIEVHPNMKALLEQFCCARHSENSRVYCRNWFAILHDRTTDKIMIGGTKKVVDEILEKADLANDEY